jgi:hypothetical protein
VTVLGVAPSEIQCDSTKGDSTFVFVDTAFAGANPDGSRTAPFRVLADALGVASTPGRGPTTVIIADSPVFADPLVLPDGVSVRGGYTERDGQALTGTWRRDLSRRPTWLVRAEHAAEGVLVGLRAAHIKRATVVADVTIQTEPMAGLGTTRGTSTIGVLAVDAPGLRLIDVSIFAGDAQHAGPAPAAPAAANGPNVNGRNGNLRPLGGAAPPPLSAGLAGAHNAACDVPDSQGGAGGETGGAAPHPGKDAPSGAKGSTSGTNRGESGASRTTVAANGAHGVSGAAFSSEGLLSLTGDGQVGTNGLTGRGGGGGYSDYVYYVTIHFQTEGGSGGAGGCGGPGGPGGFAGGFSLGLAIVGSPGLVVHGGSVTAGRGGDGSAGAEGAAGAKGGTGGSGYTYTQSTPHAVSSGGGAGSDGEKGGAGGDGAGGSSIAVYCASSTPTVEASPQLTSGTVGAKGTGAKSLTSQGCGF